MPPKGVSMDEKRRRILEIFKDAQVYSMKEIEKIGSKKGISGMQIPDIVKALCDDNLIDTDKIGSGNFYWSLPSKEGQKKRSRLESLQSKVENTISKINCEKKRKTELAEAREPTAARTKLMEDHHRLKQSEEQLKEELKKFADKDPAVLKKLEQDLSKAFQTATLWANNLEAVSKKHGMSDNDIEARFEIAEPDLQPVDWAYFNLPEPEDIE
eukprot:767731-Hanusia_phi.AAC.5